MQKVLFTVGVWTVICWAVCVGYDLAQHHNYEALKQVMHDVHDKCPEITRLYKLPNMPVPGVQIPEETLEHRELLVIEFSKDPGQHVEKKPEFKYVGNMHGNEVRGREMILKLMDYLCDVYQGGEAEEESRFAREQLMWLLDNTRLHFLPSMNPDGYEAAANKDPVEGKRDWLTGRENADGVDLNRNFPDLDRMEYKMQDIPGHPNNHLDNFAQVLKKYSKELQPETQMMMDWLHSNNFVLSANMHDGDLVANYPMDETVDGSPHHFTPSADHKTFLYLAESYSFWHKTMATKHKPCDMEGDFFKNNGTTNGADWYSVPGGLQDYNYLSTNTMEITVEMGCEKFPPADQLPAVWEDNRDALINYMFQSHIGIKGSIIMPEQLPQGMDQLIATIKVTDEETGTYIAKDILSSPTGDYFRLLADGVYTVQAVVPIKLRNGRMVDIVRWACVKVKNAPRRLNQAQIVDFDFSNLDIAEDGEPCLMDDYDSNMEAEQYYDILALLQGLGPKYKNNY